MKACDVCDKPSLYRHGFDSGPGIDGGSQCCRCNGCEDWCGDDSNSDACLTFDCTGKAETIAELHCPPCLAIRIAKAAIAKAGGSHEQ